MLGSAYASKRLDLHPRDVQGAASGWHQGLKSVRCAPHWVHVDRRFWLSSRTEGLSTDALRLYGVRGIMWLSGKPVDVTLEFSVWSDSLSEVGIRPTGISWPVGSERYERRVAAVLDAVGRSVCSQAQPDECTPEQPRRNGNPEHPTSTSREPRAPHRLPRTTPRRNEESKSKSRMKRAALAIGTSILIFFTLAATWVAISIYRFDHAIHHIALPASLISKGHDDLLVMVKGPNHSEQVLILHRSRGRAHPLQIPNTMLLPLGGGKSAPIDTLDLQHPTTIIGGLERLGLPIRQFVGLDLHMFSSKSVIGRLASGQASAASLIANPLSASSILEQVASHIYLGPGTPTSAVMSLTTVSAAHVVAIPTTRDAHGRVALAGKSGSKWGGLR